MLREQGDVWCEEAVDDIDCVPKWAAPTNPQASRTWRAVALSVSYVAVYLVLDRISFIEPLHGIDITPWNPSTGIMLALLIVKGVRWSPVVLVAELISDATLPQISVPPAPLFVAAIVVTVGYASAAAILRHVGFEASLRRTSDVVVLLAAAIVSSCLVASGFVATYAAAGVVPWTGCANAVFQYWIGDAIGIAVFTPPLLMITQSLALPAPTDRGRNWLQLLEVPAQGASIVAALAAVFLQIGGDHPLGVFYVLFLPLIWIATRRGVVAASWALLAIQAGLIAGLEIRDQWEVPLRAFQLLMFALAATGLILGAVVSERHRLSLALAASESRRAAILNTARDGVLTIDAHGQIQSINPAVERLFELPGNLLIGHDIHDLVDAPPELLARLRRMHRLAGRRGDLLGASMRGERTGRCSRSSSALDASTCRAPSNTRWSYVTSPRVERRKLASASTRRNWRTSRGSHLPARWPPGWRTS